MVILPLADSGSFPQGMDAIVNAHDDRLLSSRQIVGQGVFAQTLKLPAGNGDTGVSATGLACVCPYTSAFGNRNIVRGRWSRSRRIDGTVRSSTAQERFRRVVLDSTVPLLEKAAIFFFRKDTIHE